MYIVWSLFSFFSVKEVHDLFRFIYLQRLIGATQNKKKLQLYCVYVII